MSRRRAMLEVRAGLALVLALAAWQAPGGAQARTAADGVFTAEQAARGERGYRVFCAHCHARDLSGDNSGDAGAPPLRGDSFREGSTVLALFTKIAETMPLDAQGALGTDRYLDILAYVLQENGFPAGERELADDAGALEQIRITGRAPSR